jgi:ABC-type polysaccharide/polyol phosphate export permease
MRFPRVLIPFASLLTESMAWVAALPLLPLMMAVYGIGPTTALVWLPVVVAVTALLALAVTYPATLIGIWAPELRPFANSFARAALFVAPGLVALDQITGTARTLMPINPLTGVFESYRDVLLYGQAPAAWELLLPLGAALLIFGIGLPVYLRDQSRLAKLVG